MKKLSILLPCAILLSSCSFNLDQILQVATNTPTAAPTYTVGPTDIPTLTPTVATATFTITPTLVGQKSPTSTPEFTATAETLTPTTASTPTATVEMKGFVTVFTSQSEFFKAGICEPTSVKFTAQVANAAGTAFVVLFVRFKSRQTGATSEWTSITMQPLGAGTYVHDLEGAQMKALDSFNNAWVQYQLVATSAGTKEVGRTAIFNERLSLLNCVPTPTSLESPTALVP